MKYEGPLDYKKMSYEVRRGYASWAMQRDKCYNKNNERYKHYGAKGVKVLYTSREFVGWWLEKIKTKSSWKCPTVSRINHDDNYEFSNINLEEKSVNSIERNKRCGLPNPGKIILVEHSNGMTTFCSSFRYANEYFNIPLRSIIDLLQKRYGKNNKNELKFSYLEAYNGY